MSKNKIFATIIVTIIFSFLLIFPSEEVLADSSTLIVNIGDSTEILYADESKTIAEGTVIYDGPNNILTLNNYNDGAISYTGTEDLTVKLVGTNTITPGEYTDGIRSYNSGLIVEGEGSLSIIGPDDGIYTGGGDLTVNSGNIQITDSTFAGLYSNGNKVNINGGNITISIAPSAGIYFGVYAMEEVNISGGNITINNAQYGLYSEGKINITGGKIIVNSKMFGIAAGNSLSIEAVDYLKVVTPKDAGLPIVVIIIDEQSDISIASDLKILPKDISKQQIVFTPENMDIIVLGKTGAVAGLYEEGEVLTTSNIPNELTIAPESSLGSYTITKGNNQTLTLNSISGYTITIDGDYSSFESFKVGDLNLIKDEDYIVTEGSTIITFTKKGIDKLNTLSQGSYDIIATYSNGEIVNGKITLKENIENGKATLKENIENPKTGDNINLYIIIGIISLLGFVLTTTYVRKKA